MSLMTESQLVMDYKKVITKSEWGLAGAPLHDPCTIAWLLAPELFKAQTCWVGIETQGEYTQGMTVVDRYQLTNQPANATVLFDVDRQGFVDLLIERLHYFTTHSSAS